MRTVLSKLIPVLNVAIPEANDHCEHYLELSNKNFKDGPGDRKRLVAANYIVWDRQQKASVFETKVDIADPNATDTLFWLAAASSAGEQHSFGQVEIGEWDFVDILWKKDTRMLSFGVISAKLPLRQSA